MSETSRAPEILSAFEHLMVPTIKRRGVPQDQINRDALLDCIVRAESEGVPPELLNASRGMAEDTPRRRCYFAHEACDIFVRRWKDREIVTLND